VEKHRRVLRAERPVTERPRIAMSAEGGTVIEVFGRVSADTIDRAHADPTVQAPWAEFAAACEYLPIAQVPETGAFF